MVCTKRLGFDSNYPVLMCIFTDIKVLNHSSLYVACQWNTDNNL